MPEVWRSPDVIAVVVNDARLVLIPVRMLRLGGVQRGYSIRGVRGMSEGKRSLTARAHLQVAHGSSGCVRFVGRSQPPVRSPSLPLGGCYPWRGRCAVAAAMASAPASAAATRRYCCCSHLHAPKCRQGCRALWCEQGRRVTCALCERHVRHPHPQRSPPRCCQSHTHPRHRHSPHRHCWPKPHRHHIGHGG